MGKKTALAILGGGLTKDKAGQWRTTNFGEKGDNHGTLGDSLRVRAGACLYSRNPSSFVIASGGRGQFKKVAGAPSLSAVIKKELISLGVPANKIIEENRSNNTYRQLLELQKIKRSGKVEDLVIVSNRYHLPRLKAMIKYGPGLAILKKMFKNIKLKSAEDILLKFHPAEWEKKIKKAYQSETMRQRVALEQQGAKQIKAGKYNFK